MTKGQVARETVLWLIALFLALVCLRSGFMKMPGAPGEPFWIRDFQRWGYPDAFRLVVGGVSGREQLQRDEAIELGVLREVNLAHAALTQRADEPVPGSAIGRNGGDDSKNRDKLEVRSQKASLEVRS